MFQVVIQNVKPTSEISMKLPLIILGIFRKNSVLYSHGKIVRDECTFIDSMLDDEMILQSLITPCPPPGMPQRALASGGLSSLQHSSGGRNGTSFHGCVRNLYINGKLQDLGAGQGPAAGGAGFDAAQRAGGQWLGRGVEPGCQPCQRGTCVQGDCHPTGHRGFTCTCHPGWTGTLCDQQVNNPCDGNK